MFVSNTTAPSRVCRQYAKFPGRLSAWVRHRRQSTASVFEKAKAAFDYSSRSTRIVGTVPHHKSYTLLRHPDPVSTYPSKLDAHFSPLYRDLTLQAKLHGGLVNFWWSDEGGPVDSRSWAQTQADEGVLGQGSGPSSSSSSVIHGEHYPLTFFGAPDPSHSWRARIGVLPQVSRGSMNIAETFHEAPSPTHEADPETDGALLLVCTHGARDCRCGDAGSALIGALRDELSVRRRRSNSAEDTKSSVHSESVWEKIKLGETAHIGGHKHAANLLAFPFGDWLGNLTPSHAPLILGAVAAQLRMTNTRIVGERSHIESTRGSPRLDTFQTLAPLVADATLWRGRMGLTKDEQVRLLEKHV